MPRSSLKSHVPTESAGIALGLTALAAALVAANSALAADYSAFWERSLLLGFDGIQSFHTLNYWVDNGLMPILFLLLGIQVKRELIAPVRMRFWSVPPRMGGAFVSALVPIVLYVGAVTAALLTSHPALASRRVVLAAGAILALVIFNQLNVRRASIYMIAGVVLWLALLPSGINPVIAGVILAVAMPATREIHEDEVFEQNGFALEAFEQASGPRIVSWQLRQQEALQRLEHAAVDFQAPLTRIESPLRSAAALLIVPVFVLANAGVAVDDALRGFDWRTMAGLAIGAFTARTVLSMRRRGEDFGHRTSHAVWWRVNAEAGWLAGVGLAISIFAAKLLFDLPADLETAKLGVITGSAAVWALGWWKSKKVTGLEEEPSYLRMAPTPVAVADGRDEW